MTDSQRKRLHMLEQMAYCEIGLTWKSVAMSRLDIINELGSRLKEAETPCQCCRDHGCSDGCRCKQIGDF